MARPGSTAPGNKGAGIPLPPLGGGAQQAPQHLHCRSLSAGLPVKLMLLHTDDAHTVQNK